jgi:hypothetical protein
MEFGDAIGQLPEAPFGSAASIVAGRGSLVVSVIGEILSDPLAAGRDSLRPTVSVG